MVQFLVNVRLATGQYVSVTISAQSTCSAGSAASAMFPGCTVNYIRQQ